MRVDSEYMKTLTQISKEYGISYQTLFQRIKADNMKPEGQMVVGTLLCDAFTEKQIAQIVAPRRRGKKC